MHIQKLRLQVFDGKKNLLTWLCWVHTVACWPRVYQEAAASRRSLLHSSSPPLTQAVCVADIHTGRFTCIPHLILVALVLALSTLWDTTYS